MKILQVPRDRINVNWEVGTWYPARIGLEIGSQKSKHATPATKSRKKQRHLTCACRITSLSFACEFLKMLLMFPLTNSCSQYCSFLISTFILSQIATLIHHLFSVGHGKKTAARRDFTTKRTWRAVAHSIELLLIISPSLKTFTEKIPKHDYSKPT